MRIIIAWLISTFIFLYPAETFLNWKKKAKNNLMLLSPQTFCNRWDAYTRKYLQHVTQLDDSDENIRCKDHTKKLMTSIHNIFQDHIKRTKESLGYPALRLIPYFLGLNIVPPAVGWYYGYVPIYFPLYLGLSNVLIGALHQKYMNYLKDELHILESQCNIMKQAFKIE